MSDPQAAAEQQAHAEAMSGAADLAAYVRDSPVSQWFEAGLYFRIPDGRHRITEGTVKTGIQVTWQGDAVARKTAALAEAGRAFREMGFGTIIELALEATGAGGRMSITVTPALFPVG